MPGDSIGLYPEVIALLPTNNQLEDAFLYNHNKPDCPALVLGGIKIEYWTVLSTQESFLTMTKF